MLNIDEQISRLHRLYKELTGEDPKPSEAPLSPIPPGADPADHVRNNLRRLEWMLNQIGHRGVKASPQLTVYERDDKWCCEVDLPGVREEELSVQVELGVLRIRAHRELAGGQGAHVVFSDAFLGDIERVIPLPAFVDESTFEARFDAGVLVVSCRKNPSRIARNLKIEVA